MRFNVDVAVGMRIKDSITIQRSGNAYGYPSLVRIPNGIARRPTSTSATAKDAMKMYIACNNFAQKTCLRYTYHQDK